MRLLFITENLSQENYAHSECPKNIVKFKTGSSKENISTLNKRGQKSYS